jgi:hypothetical protein
MAVWLVVLVADTAAAKGTTILAYTLAGLVAFALVLAEVWAATAGRDQLKPQPVRVRADDHLYRRRR